MAGLNAQPRRPSRTPARPVRALASIEPATEPPSKKRKFLPGGPGGGGRYIDENGNEIPREVALAGVSRTAPRSRPRREALDHVPKRSMQNGETPTITRSAMQTRPRRERTARYVPPPSTPRPRYSNAAAAAAASLASDGYKPREERGWEEFHPEMDIDVGMFLFTADEMDGRSLRDDPKELLRQASHGHDSKGGTNDDIDMKDVPTDDGHFHTPHTPLNMTPMKRKPGRPPRRPESMLTGLGSPPAPRIVPLPTHNPKERLNLPKPSFRQYNHFLQYEEDHKENQVNYVDRSMAHVGFQESDRFELPSKVLIRLSDGQHIEDETEVGLRLESDGTVDMGQMAPVVGRVEYDMDEQDVEWLEHINEQRRSEGVDAIKPAIFEITMTQIEKEYHALEKRIPKPQPRHAQINRPRSSSQAAVNGDPNPPGDEPDSKCAICDDGDCENANAIIFCDGCDLAVHQECYGVPFIPEGQWFCRKCKEIGRGTATCIFCPNVDGAFKQTSTLRWSHLLCAIWIPEVTIANMTFMEPIQDVDKVPKSRWRLHCYICNQKMGACIQCGNKNCYLAFHVTCARRAKLFLKMKSQHQGGIDASALKAFCDKHVPQDWRRMHDTDNAIVEAKRWYKHAMKDRKWADSQSAALELGAPPMPDGGLHPEPGVSDDTIAVTKRRRNQPPRMSWRLPSGAPIVPTVVYNTVDTSLQRFTIRKRKEFVEKACKYWTLKREARRGAALLKRLQLQLEGFSSMEITRRNFAGMGAVGRPRLLRRIEFAELLQEDIARLRTLCAQTRKREELRLQEVELLKELVDTVYFPIPALLSPILQRAQKLDDKTHIFRPGFDAIATRLNERYYTSVSDFSRDLSRVFDQVLGAADSVDADNSADIEAIHSRLIEAAPRTAEHMALTQEQKDHKRLAKRIVKAVKEPLELAMKKEAELRGREMQEELRKLDLMGIFASTTSNTADLAGEDAPETNGRQRNGSEVSAVVGASPDPALNGDVTASEAEDAADEGVISLNFHGTGTAMPILEKKPKATLSKTASLASSNSEAGIPKNTTERAPHAGPLSPPISRSSLAPNGAPLPVPPVLALIPSHSIGSSNGTSPGAPHDVFAHGGVPWYLEPFDPVGTTIYDERYTGPAVLRDMSEELSDMDEDTLTELANAGGAAAGAAPGNSAGLAVLGNAAATITDGSDGASKSAEKKPARKKRPKRSNWR